MAKGRGGKQNRFLCSCGRRIVSRRSQGFSGVTRPNPDHDLCQRCWKSFQDRAAGRRIHDERNRDEAGPRIE